MMLLFPVSVRSMPAPVQLESNIKYYSLAGKMELLLDDGGSLTLDQILAPEIDHRFKTFERETPSFGFYRGALWIRFTVKNNGMKPGRHFLELGFPLLDNITLYSPEKNGTYSRQTTGYAHPFQSRKVSHRNFLFPIRTDPGEQKTFYLRITSKDRMEVPIGIWDEYAFYQSDRVSQAFLWVFYGVVLGMAIYNLAVFISLRVKTYKLYIYFIMTYIIWQATTHGVVYEILSSWLPTGWNHYIPANLFLLVFFATRLTIEFLKTEQLPVQHILLKSLQWISIIAIFIIWFIPYREGILAGTTFVILTISAILTSGYTFVYRGNKSARHYMIAWTPFLIGALIYSLKVLAWIPSNQLTQYAVEVGSLLQVIILSNGLRDQINLIRLEKEEAKEDAILHLKQSEKQLEAFLFTLASTIEARDKYTGGHVERVAGYSRDLAGAAGLSSQKIRTVYLGAIVHDVGKILIQDSILNKNGPYTEEERSIMMRHTEEGSRILKRIYNMTDVANIAHYHHERWDGKGYPEGLASRAIPVEARIVCIADYWDAITTDRPYRKAIPIAEARRILLEERGRALDPDLLDIFFDETLNIYRRYLPGANPHNI